MYPQCAELPIGKIISVTRISVTRERDPVVTPSSTLVRWKILFDSYELYDDLIYFLVLIRVCIEFTTKFPRWPGTIVNEMLGTGCPLHKAEQLLEQCRCMLTMRRKHWVSYWHCGSNLPMFRPVTKLQTPLQGSGGAKTASQVTSSILVPSHHKTITDLVSVSLISTQAYQRLKLYAPFDAFQTVGIAHWYGGRWVVLIDNRSLNRTSKLPTPRPS
jgi:hypothetical protein